MSGMLVRTPSRSAPVSATSASGGVSSIPVAANPQSFNEAPTLSTSQLVLLCPRFEEFWVPTYDIDCVWHAHQLHPRSYFEETCLRIATGSYPFCPSNQNRNVFVVVVTKDEVVGTGVIVVVGAAAAGTSH